MPIGAATRPPVGKNQRLPSNACHHDLGPNAFTLLGTGPTQTGMLCAGSKPSSGRARLFQQGPASMAQWVLLGQQRQLRAATTLQTVSACLVPPVAVPKTALIVCSSL